MKLVSVWSRSHESYDAKSITMAECRIIRSLCAICAIWLCCTGGIYALRCDFGNPDGLLSNNALFACHVDNEVFNFATVICPSHVNDKEYVWHPQPTSDERTHINTYVTDDGNFRSVPLSDVMRSESENAAIWFKSNASTTELHYKKTANKLIAITGRRLIFICGPKDLVMTDELQRHLNRLDGFGRMQPLPWTPSTPLTQVLAKIGLGLGAFFLNRGHAHLPLQGCGSRPSPLFAADSEVTIDPVTGIRSCVADPMSRLPIGFVCEGRLEPDDCMISLLDTNGEVVKAPGPHYYWNYYKFRPWVVARYFDDLALPPFNGECRCIDAETGHVKARIEFRSKTDYVCDIASMIERHRANPINGPWCSVVLHPGSRLTIRFPTADVDSVSNDATQLLPTDQFEAEFLPKDLTALRQLKTVYDFDVYEEISYNEALAGDALELDVSKVSQGEVKLKYHEDKPLALRAWPNSFFYHWTLKSENDNVPDKIHAIVQVSLAFTHHYRTIGCDRGPHSVFNPMFSKAYCSGKRMGNGIGKTYECSLRIMRNDRQAGIHCRPDEELLPKNCAYEGYDLHSNKIVPFPVSMKTGMLFAIPRFQVFDMGMQNHPVSYACICVDHRGYEKSKLILEYSREVFHSYKVRLEDAPRTLLPQILMPWREMGLSRKVLTSSNSLIAKNVSKTSVKLQVGTLLSMSCAFDHGVHSVTGNGVIRTTWLPFRPKEFHYTFSNTSYGRELIRTPHKDAIVGTLMGLNVAYKEVETRRGYQILNIESRRGAILISKDPLHKQHVPMTFVCGKAPEPADVSITSGEVSSSPSPYITGSLEQYTWHLVQVNVETTDPYMQGCGVTYASDELFKPETPQLYDADGGSQFGCKIDLQAAKEAAFYCPAPYVLDPPNCFSQVSVDGVVRNISDLSQSLVASRSNHFAILSFDSSLVGVGETLRRTTPLECRCVTIKGIVLSTIQIENYYAK
ncbi:hypothetical protein, conserved [Babesia ovata]|uniref:6-Cys domain-containing protein n=1 Tax=Babesia ovata TaxID=189622 RepID=A0A2H6KFL0_9APIC|nr:uncharacterized protein BOVATA_032750 [Babesia ovata]GBE61782.1 hypothetical protein, conserved [Babesia ovata]